MGKIDKSKLKGFIDRIAKLLEGEIIKDDNAIAFLSRAKKRLEAVRCLAGNGFSANDVKNNLTTCCNSLPEEEPLKAMSDDDKVSACESCYNAVYEFTEPLVKPAAEDKKETYRWFFLAIGIFGEGLELIVSLISTFIDANWFGWAVVGVRATQIICLVLSLFSVIAFCFDVVPSVASNGEIAFRKRISVAKADHNKLIFGSFMFITLLIGTILTTFILKGLPLFASLILLGFAAIVYISFFVTIYIADDKPNSDKKPDVNNTLNINISSTQQPNPNNEESSDNSSKTSYPPADITQQPNPNNEESSDNNPKTNPTITTINTKVNQTGNKTTSTPLVIFIILFFAVVILVGVFVANPQFLYGTSTITYKIDDVTQTKSVVYNQKYSIEVPEKVGYTFLGLYDKEKNGIQYVDAKGDCIKPWDSKIRDENKELFAQWKINKYTFIYDIKGGEGQDLNNFECDYEANLPTLVSNVSKRGHTFLGWTNSENRSAKLISDCDGILVPGREKLIFPVYDIPTTEKNIYLYAKWQGNKYDVILDVNGGDPIIKTNISVTFGDNCYFGIAKKLGYSFVGWCDNIKLDNLITDSDGETLYPWNYTNTITLYAKWQAKTNEIIFYGNGATNGKMENQLIKTDETKNLTSNLYIRAGYTFMGWATSSTSTVAMYIDGATYKMTAGDVTLYAVWAANDNAIVFNANGGEGIMKNQIIKTDSEAILNANTFSKTDYNFMGWATSPAGSVIYANNASYTMGVNKSNNLYAVWSQTYYTEGLTFEPYNDGYKVLKYTGQSSDVIIPYLYNNKKVISIGDCAFEKCGILTNIKIPNSVISIGAIAFSDCTGLTSMEIPNGVIDIGLGAFSGCTVLTSIEIPSNVTSINTSWFLWCSGLTTLNVDIENKTYYSEGNCIIQKSNNELILGCQNSIIPNSVQTIGAGAFLFCENLTSIRIPNGVTSIGSAAFGFCTGLTSIEIPNGVISIGTAAFSDCTGLTSIEIPNGVTSIGSVAFGGCAGLTSIEIPASVTSIARPSENAWETTTSPFERCSGLTTINVAIENKTYYSEGNCIIQKSNNELIVGCKNSIIPSNVTRIGRSAFSGCTGLTSITIPSSVTYISSYAFSDCTGLTSITIPSSVTYISSYAFSGCTGLTSITIPSNVTRIGDSAFSGCTGLTSITIPSSVTDIYNYAFSGCTGLTSITIPSSVTYISSAAFSGWKSNQIIHIKVGHLRLVDGMLIGTVVAVLKYVGIVRIN